jgi:hypothetical protein
MRLTPDLARMGYLLGYGVSARDVPQRLKPGKVFYQLYRRSKDLLHPAVEHSKT